MSDEYARCAHVHVNFVLFYDIYKSYKNNQLKAEYMYTKFIEHTHSTHHLDICTLNHVVTLGITHDEVGWVCLISNSFLHSVTSLQLLTVIIMTHLLCSAFILSSCLCCLSASLAASSSPSVLYTNNITNHTLEFDNSYGF